MKLLLFGLETKYVLAPGNILKYTNYMFILSPKTKVTSSPNCQFSLVTDVTACYNYTSERESIVVAHTNFKQRQFVLPNGITTDFVYF